MIALFLGLVSAVSVMLAVVIALKIPKWFLTLYIGLLVTCMGFMILFTAKRQMHFSWRKIAGISLLAAFNKGISGGGMWPLVMGGQMLKECRRHSHPLKYFRRVVIYVGTYLFN